jgi:ribonuclease HII
LPDLAYEHRLRTRGVGLVAGVDEAGRGPLAGPVVAAAVVLPPDLDGSEEWLGLLDDSKKLTRRQREAAADAVKQHAVAWAVGQVDPRGIERLGIGRAAFRAMLMAVDGLNQEPAYLLLDFIHVRECPFDYEAIIKGDSVSYSIAAASNVAKVTRDALMVDYAAEYPGYGFDQHKGYPTPRHLERLRELGPCVIHRLSFGPVAQAGMRFLDAPHLSDETRITRLRRREG